MPLWFVMTNVGVVVIATLGMIVLLAGTFRSNDRAMIAGGVMFAAPILAFMFVAVGFDAFMALSGI